MDKLCRYCKVRKPETEFEVALTTPGKIYRRLKCKKCKQDTQNVRRSKTSDWLQDYKREHPCIRCGFADVRALTFHHKVKQDKYRNLADMKSWSIRQIQVEIAKCDVLCANCHMIVEHEHRNIVGV